MIFATATRHARCIRAHTRAHTQPRRVSEQLVRNYSKKEPGPRRTYVRLRLLFGEQFVVQFSRSLLRAFHEPRSVAARDAHQVPLRVPVRPGADRVPCTKRTHKHTHTHTYANTTPVRTDATTTTKSAKESSPAARTTHARPARTHARTQTNREMQQCFRIFSLTPHPPSLWRKTIGSLSSMYFFSAFLACTWQGRDLISNSRSCMS